MQLLMLNEICAHNELCAGGKDFVELYNASILRLSKVPAAFFYRREEDLAQFTGRAGRTQRP